MPRVPTYDDFQASPAPLPQPRLSAPEMPDLAGRQAQQTGAALMDAGAMVGQTAMRAAEEANILRAEEATNRLRQKQLELAYGEGGAFTVEGANVLDRKSGQRFTDEYLQAFDRQAAEIAGTLGNDDQRRKFSGRIQAARAEFFSGLARHERAQIARWQEGVMKDTVETETRAALTNPYDSEAIGSALERVRMAVSAHAVRIGMPADEAVSRAVGGIHAGVISQAIADERLDYARQYLKEFGEEIDQKDRVRFTAHLKDVAEGDDTERAVEDYIADHPEMTREEAALWAQRTYAGKQETAALTSIARYYGNVEAQQKDREQASEDTAQRLIAAGKRVPSSILSNTSGHFQLWYADRLRAEASRGASGAERADSTLVDTLNLMAITDPTGFMQTDLGAFAGLKGMANVIQKQAKMRQGGQDINQRMGTVTSALKYAEHDIQAAGISTVKKRDGGYADERYPKLAAVIEAEVGRFLDDNHGRAPNVSEMRMIIDQAMLPVVIPDTTLGFRTDDKTMLGLVEADDLPRAMVQWRVIDQLRTQAPKTYARLYNEAKSAKGGKEPTGADLQRLFTQRMLRGGTGATGEVRTTPLPTRPKIDERKPGKVDAGATGKW